MKSEEEKIPEIGQFRLMGEIGFIGVSVPQGQGSTPLIGEGESLSDDGVVAFPPEGVFGVPILQPTPQSPGAPM